MGSALLQRVISKNIAYSICIVKPTPPSALLKALPNTTWLSSPDQIDPTFRPDIVIIAVKPLQLANILPRYERFKDSVFLSVAVGVTTAKLEALFKSSAPLAVVRSLPNLPSKIGQGLSPIFANTHANKKQRDLCDAFLKSVGETVWVKNENLINIAGAVSASGPAYVFAFCEAMAKAGETLGLSPDDAMKVAKQTLIGSSALLAQSPEGTAVLRQAVTTPGGVTEAGFKQLLSTNGLNELMLKTISATIERAKELAKLA